MKFPLKSEALKKRWSKIPKAKRTKMMSERASLKWSKMTQEERSKHALMMVTQRVNRKVKSTNSQ